MIQKQRLVDFECCLMGGEGKRKRKGQKGVKGEIVIGGLGSIYIGQIIFQFNLPVERE